MHKELRHGLRLQWIQPLLAAVVLLLAAYFLLTALCAIANFAWRQPMFDQFRLYGTYLSLPFPDNALQLENGHRPVLPALVRIAEITWFDANQRLQILLGTLCALATAALIAWSGWRERHFPLPVRAGFVFVAVAGIFWLANARMLMHGNELVHTYLLTTCVTVAALCVWRSAGASRPWLWIAAATVACAAATFCFGPGVSSFVAILMLMLVLRLPYRLLLVPAAGMGACLVLYLLVLPGDDAVRGMIEFRPLDSALVSARWLASPWINAWLGMADPPLHAWVAESATRSWGGRLLGGSAAVVASIPGADWRTTLSAAIGMAGIAAFVWNFVGLRRRTLALIEVLACMLGLFALATAAIIGLGRLGYLDENPDQIFADRYLVWPCIFWLSLGLLTLTRAGASRCWPAAIAGLVLIAAGLLVTHRLYSGWAAAVYRSAQTLAAAARSEIVDPAVLPNSADASMGTVVHTLQLLRERKLAMFADYRLPVGSRWQGTLLGVDEGVIAIGLVEASRGNDAITGANFLHFSGNVDTGIGRIADRGGSLAVLDAQSRVRGYAEFSFIRPGADSLRLTLPRKRGFDGYIAGYEADADYQLVQLDAAAGTAWRLARLRGGELVKP